MKHLISYFYNALLEYYPLHQAWCETWRSSSTEKTNWQSQDNVQNVHDWHEHKHVIVLAIGQVRHQSATAPSLAIHAADAVAAHQCRERDSDVIFTSHVK